MSFSSKAPTLKVLKLLKDALPLPLTYKTISHYILKLGYDRIALHSCLRRLEHSKLIINSGKKHSKLYQITKQGLRVLYLNDIKKDIRNLENSLLINPSGLD
jgi:predicted transcriptional regulator